MIERDALVLGRDVLRQMKDVHARGERVGAFTRDDIIIKEGKPTLREGILERESAAREELRAGKAAAIAHALAPESDARADVYAWGVLVFESLTGERPNGVEAPSDVVPSIDSRVDAIVRRALAPVSGRATADELLADVERVLAAPRASKTVATNARPHVRAGFARRAVAFAIDAAPFVASSVMMRNPTLLAGLVAWDAVLSIGAGTTLGKAICGLRLVELDGTALGIRRALTRALARAVLLPGALAALGVEKRAVHDMIAGSAVAFRRLT